jgi:SP family myo-inositol transporter-like MFS transporter 13
MYFSATIFAMVGFKNPTATALLIACTNFLFTLVAFGAIDYIGRRKILLLSIPFMSLGLLISGLSFANLKFPSPPLTEDPIAQLRPTYEQQPFWSVILLTSLLLFVAAYALGLGNVPWQQSELFALPVRALGSALATSTNWGCNFVVGVSFLPMMEAFTPTLTMITYALVCLATWLAVWKTYPETKGMGLEEVRALLAG